MDESPSPTVGALIRSAREAKKMSQTALANAVHLTQQTVSKWEKDLAIPSSESIRLLGDVLGLDPAALWEAAGWIDEAQLARVRLAKLAERRHIDDPIEISASGGNLDELRATDPERYAELEELAAFYLERARERRQQ